MRGTREAEGSAGRREDTFAPGVWVGSAHKSCGDPRGGGARGLLVQSRLCLRPRMTLDRALLGY